MSFVLPPLPYPANALEPYVSAQTFSFHHGKHHQTYVTNLNNFVKEKLQYQNKSLDEVVLESSKNGDKSVFNNAAQHYNHSFFWKSMKPNGGSKPPAGSAIAKAIDADFGSYDTFKNQFKTVAATHFGSGWAWLILNKAGKLEVMGTHDADTPINHGAKPLVTLDVWEHAYYLDYQNRRPDFVDTYLNHLINWDFAEDNFKNASAKL